VSFHGSVHDFFELHGRRPVLSGDVFLSEPPSVRQEAMRVQVQHHRGLDAFAYTEGGPTAYLTTNQRNNYRAHAQLRAQRQGMDGSYVFDVDQSVAFSSGGPFIPTLVTHGVIVSESRQLVFTPQEHLHMMGEPPEGHECKCFIREAVENKSPSIKKKLAGNSMHAAVLGTWLYYLLAHVEVSA